MRFGFETGLVRWLVLPAVFAVAGLGLIQPAESSDREAPVVMIGTWQAHEIAGKSVGEKTASTLIIDSEGKVSGSAGCNSLMGHMSGDRETVAFGPLATTRKLCPDDIMKQEYAFVTALGNARTYVAGKTQLELIDGSGAVVAKLQRQ